MRILVTGGAGYIGSVLVPELLAAGHEVTVVDNFMYRQTSLLGVCHHSKFSVVNADIRDAGTMREHLKSHDVVIPLAALVGAPLCKKDPVGAETINLQAPLQMFKDLGKQQWVIMPTTNSAYGSGQAGNFCDENSPLNPLSLYAKHKVEVEKHLLEHENAVSFRLATVFGMSPRMRLDLLVNDFTYRAVADGFIVLYEPHFKRNYVHVRDVVRVFMFALDNFSKMKGQVFNVGLSDANISKLELCQAIKKYIPTFSIQENPVGEDPDKRNYIISNEKLEQTGFRTEHSLHQGIQELMKGYRMIRNSLYGNI
jgi:nucleoside-diphosphate-sugar epimerase